MQQPDRPKLQIYFTLSVDSGGLRTRSNCQLTPTVAQVGPAGPRVLARLMSRLTPGIKVQRAPTRALLAPA